MALVTSSRTAGCHRSSRRCSTTSSGNSRLSHEADQRPGIGIETLYIEIDATPGCSEPGNGKLRPARQQEQHSPVGDGLAEDDPAPPGSMGRSVRVLANDDDRMLVGSRSAHANSAALVARLRVIAVSTRARWIRQDQDRKQTGEQWNDRTRLLFRRVRSINRSRFSEFFAADGCSRALMACSRRANDRVPGLPE